jgi:hypothetical protein
LDGQCNAFLLSMFPGRDFWCVVSTLETYKPFESLMNVKT